MAIVMMPNPVDTIGPTSGFALYADMRAGSNGDPWGEPEEVLGTNDTANTGRFIWDSTDDNGGFDAENIPFSEDLNLNTGTSTLLLGDSAVPVTYSGPSGETIDYLEMAAGTQVNAQVAFSNVQIGFYKNGALQETASVPGGPAIDTTSSDCPTGEQIASIKPAGTTDDEAIVTGDITMVCPDGTYPNPEDMFAQTFVFAN